MNQTLLKDDSENEKEPGFFDPRAKPHSTCTLFKTFVKLASPLIVTNLLAYFSNVTLVLFAARIPDPINVAVVGLA